MFGTIASMMQMIFWGSMAGNIVLKRHTIIFYAKFVSRSIMANVRHFAYMEESPSLNWCDLTWIIGNVHQKVSCSSLNSLVLLKFIQRSYGEHYINKLEWLAGQNKLRIGYYNFWSTPKTKEINMNVIKPTGRENQNWFLFKTTESRLWYLVDKNGKVHNEKILKAVINGERPTSF